MKLGFIGSGNMAEALIKGVLASKLTNDIISSDVNAERLGYIKKQYKTKTTMDNKEVVRKSDIIFLAVKPQHMKEVLEGVKDVATGDKLFVSIAAGIKISFIESIIESRVIRVMPNTPCLVLAAASAFAAGKKATADDKEKVNKLLNSCGICFEVEEEKLDVVTALSGSGPAFFAYIIQAFTEAGKKAGLEAYVAQKLAEQTAMGTAKLLMEKDMDPEELIEMVSSPGGTTVEGRKILESSDVKKIIEETVKAAFKRSKELGK